MEIGSYNNNNNKKKYFNRVNLIRALKTILQLLLINITDIWSFQIIIFPIWNYILNIGYQYNFHLQNGFIIITNNN